jgi:hypothetical protein
MSNESEQDLRIKAASQHPELITRICRKQWAEGILCYHQQTRFEQLKKENVL